jgi:hypothetical protein
MYVQQENKIRLPHRSTLPHLFSSCLLRPLRYNNSYVYRTQQGPFDSNIFFACCKLCRLVSVRIDPEALCQESRYMEFLSCSLPVNVLFRHLYVCTTGPAPNSNSVFPTKGPTQQATGQSQFKGLSGHAFWRIQSRWRSSKVDCNSNPCFLLVSGCLLRSRSSALRWSRVIRRKCRYAIALPHPLRQSGDLLCRWRLVEPIL